MFLLFALIEDRIIGLVLAFHVQVKKLTPAQKGTETAGRDIWHWEAALQQSAIVGHQSTLWPVPDIVNHLPKLMHKKH